MIKVKKPVRDFTVYDYYEGGTVDFNRTYYLTDFHEGYWEEGIRPELLERLRGLQEYLKNNVNPFPKPRYYGDSIGAAFEFEDGRHLTFTARGYVLFFNTATDRHIGCEWPERCFVCKEPYEPNKTDCGSEFHFPKFR